jgi:hypothetical protein
MKLQKIRKPAPMDKHVFSRISTEVDGKLTELAEDYGVTRAHLFRIALNDMLLKHSA